jgi:hypothetical protein
MQISTCWKDNSKYFPTGGPPSSDTSRTGCGDRNKSMVVSASFQIESFKIRKVRDMIDFDSSPMLDIQQPLYTLVIRGF